MLNNKNHHGRSFDCHNDSLYLSVPTAAAPPSQSRTLRTVRIYISKSSGDDLGDGGGCLEEKKEDDHPHDHLPHHHTVHNGHRNRNRSFSNTSILAALAALFVGPLLLWDDYPAAKIELLPWIRHIQLVWMALLHISIWPVVFVTAAVSTFFASVAAAGGGGGRTHYHQSISSLQHYKLLPLLLSLLFTGLISTQSFLQMAFPSLIWNPALWIPPSYFGGGGYTVYLPQDLQKELDGGCFTTAVDVLDHGAAERDNDDRLLLPTFTTSSPSSSSLLLRSSTNHNQRQPQPLCLSEQQWSHLSSGTLSSHNPNDVATVLRGLTYLQTQSNGLVINALARNIKESIPDLRRNIEGLVPLLGGGELHHGGGTTTKLTFVAFENDSVDGTREELSSWAEEVNSSQDHDDVSSSSNNNNKYNSRYNVDLIQCPPPNTNCKLNIIDRNEIYGGKENKTSSGVGKLGEFRQIILDHVVANYGDYSHMIVFDVDLGVSISPLGILHTLGLMSESGDDGLLLAEEYVVASAATQVWPGTFGTV